MKKIAIGALMVYAAMSQFSDSFGFDPNSIDQNSQMLVD